MPKTSGPTGNDKALGDEVRQPRSGPGSVGTEHKALFDRIYTVLFRRMVTVELRPHCEKRAMPPEIQKWLFGFQRGPACLRVPQN